MKSWRDKIKNIPSVPGIYLFYKNDELVYIGKATSLKNRVRSYLKPKTARPIESLISLVTDVKWKRTDSVLEALILEANYIKKFKPKYNIKEKDDRSWNFLVITKEDFPKLKSVREKELNVKDYKYTFGPYAEVKISQILKILHYLFNISRCSPNQKSPCFDYHLNRCLGVCTNEISSKDYIKKVIKPLVLFLRGKKRNLITSLEKEMKIFSLNEEFEEAKRIRNQLFSLNKIMDFSLLDKSFLEEEIKIKTSIKRIEGYDISNLGSEVMVGSMVVFENGKPLKEDYKKFRIKKVKKQSDVDCLKEVIKRRIKHSEWPNPDLILVDGGKPQVNAVEKVLNSHIPVIGIAKGKKRNKDELIYSENNRWVEQEKSLLIKVRDEAHRFAINYQRKIKRGKLIEKSN